VPVKTWNVWHNKAQKAQYKTINKKIIIKKEETAAQKKPGLCPGFFLFRAALARFDWRNITPAARRRRRKARRADCSGALKFRQLNPVQGLNGRIGKIRLQMPAGGSAPSRDLFLQSGCFSLKIMHLL
jgi:hypothetical protein